MSGRGLYRRVVDRFTTNTQLRLVVLDCAHVLRERGPVMEVYSCRFCRDQIPPILEVGRVHAAAKREP